MHALPRPLAATALLAVLLAGCSSPAPPASDASSGADGSALGDGHGFVEGAAEMPEPQPHLVSLSPEGDVGMLDLLSEEASAVGEIAPPESAVTDGRFVFALRAGVVEVVDSGVWTLPHGDHSHYYRAPARVVGEVTAASAADGGLAQIESSTTRTTLLFADGELVVLDREALGRGEIAEVALSGLPARATAAAPIGAWTLVGDSDAGSVSALADDGAVAGEIACPDPSGARTTRAGVVIGCADGAVVATVADDAVELAHVPYPAGLSPEPAAATSFASRNDRAAVAGLSGETGFWLLAVRDREWRHIALPDLHLVTAVDDADDTVLAVDETGRLLVIDPELGTVIAGTEPLVADSLADPTAEASVTLSVDADRAYLSGGAEASTWEIDYRDDARIAREFETPSGLAFTLETGR
ncbi:MAG: hypothetical protein ABW040_06410 [Microbacteriaceae bacterium]